MYDDANDDNGDEGSEGVCLGRLAPKQGPPILQEVPNTGKSILRGWGGVTPSQYIWGCPKTDSHWTNRQIERQMTQMCLSTY